MSGSQMRYVGVRRYEVARVLGAPHFLLLSQYSTNLR